MLYLRLNMQWATVLNWDKVPLPSLGYQDRILCIGSCFAAEMGKRLAEAKFRVMLNPFGTLFQPLALAQAYSLALSVGETRWREWAMAGVLQLEEDLFVHYGCHSQVYAPDRDALLHRLEQLAVEVSAWRPSVVILTLGTAIAYWHKTLKCLVANCHKQPSTLFERCFLDVGTILEALEQLYHAYNFVEAWIVSISPVRHLREGLIDNQHSKSLLRVAAEQWRQRHGNIYYFPAYELLIDELRDYRFYAEDLAHPSTQAADYIWKHFVDHCIDPDSQLLYKQWLHLQRQMLHQPLFPHTHRYRLFLQKLHADMQRLAAHLPLQEELSLLELKLRNLS